MKPQPKQERPNWPAFNKLVAQGLLRYLGILPMPPELKAKQDAGNNDHCAKGGNP